MVLKTLNLDLRYIPIHLFDYKSHIHVYSPRTGSEKPLGSMPGLISGADPGFLRSPGGSNVQKGGSIS